jgi:multicomponent Na+:H+ antiporter subunit D
LSPIALWSAVAVMGPMTAAVVSLGGGWRTIRASLALGSLTSLAGAGGLVLAVWDDGVGRHLLGGWGRPLGIELYVDGLAVVMLGMTAVVGTAVSFYATSYFGDAADPRVQQSPAARGARFFAPLWLLLWTSLNGLFLSGDLFNMYVMLEILGLSAAALVTLAVTPKATQAGMRYLVISLVGSMLFLLGVALLYIGYGTLSLETLAAAEPASGASGGLAIWALAVMTAGLAAKTALFPLHAWLPPAHAGAPAPGSAILSALVVKGSFFIIVRLWLFVFGLTVPGTGAGGALLVLGLLGAGAIVWGSLLALRQVSLKRLIAYSTVAQLGYLFVMFPLLPEVGAGVEGSSGPHAWNADAWGGGIYHALSHALAKAAMFLAAGSMSYAVADDAIDSISGVAHRLPMSFLAFGLGGLSLAGIPPSGGFSAKWLLLTAGLASGQWFWVAVIAVGGLLTLAYVLMVARYALEVKATPEGFRDVPRRMEWAAIVLAIGAMLLGLRGVEILELLSIGGLGPWR